MPNIKQPHHHQHSSRIKNIKIKLRTQQIAITALNIFDDAIGRSDEDERATGVEDEEVFLPGDGGGGGVLGWVAG